MSEHSLTLVKHLPVAPEVVFDADYVVFAEVIAGLYFDYFEWFLCEIL